MVEIVNVLPHSRAYRVGIRSGDILVSLNNHEIRDVLDYRFYLAEEEICVKTLRDGKPLEFNISKGEYDDIGLDFETALMDKKHRCENQCVFCFIDQLPKGLRESLYFKDDDSRLSFLHGNYITLTNLKEEDIDRLIEMHISPINISIHTMNPELRVKMMKNKKAGQVLSYLDRISAAGLKIRGQIVLCKGLNDGKELDFTMKKLKEFYPSLESCSVVTAGLTGFRDNLYPLEDYTPQDCNTIIDQVTSFSEECFKEFGDRIFYASDEIYVKAKRELPDFDHWGEFTQIENGVGMLSSFEHEYDLALSMLSDEEMNITRTVSIATGECSFDFIQKIVKKAALVCPNLQCSVYPIINEFFGGSVTVTGLITGTDLTKQLNGKSLGDELLLSGSMLRSGKDLFLDGMTPEELSKSLSVPVRFVDNDGACFLDALLGL